MSEIMTGDRDDGFERAEEKYLYGSGGRSARRRTKADFGRQLGLRLYTATIAATHDNVMVQAFHASIAGSESEVRARMAGRYGPYLALGAEVRIGLHKAAPMVVALVPPAVAEMIWRVQRYSAARQMRHFAVDIQQNIRA